jgi:hypothetical protein
MGKQMIKNRHRTTMQVDSFVKYIKSMADEYTDLEVKDIILELIPKDENRLDKFRTNNYINETWQLNADERLRTLRLLKERGVIE